MSDVWKTLSAIDCSEHVETKGKFTYLSWTWAWAMVKERYPDATYKLLKDRVYPDETREVRVSVTIDGLEHTMWLPVLDHQNKAIRDPDAFAINSSRMRCLTKALAMHGLGHYIYSGESFPAPSPELQEKYEELKGLVANNQSWELRKFSTDNQRHMDELFNLAPEGKKTAFKKDVRDCYAKSNEELKATLAALEDCVGNPDTEYSAIEIMSELGEIERDFTWAGMNEILKTQVEQKMEEEES